MKVEQEDIYILDKIDKILYKINKDGEIVSQAKFMESGQNIYLLKNGDVLLSYNTNVAADGIIVYDSDMKPKTNINYPNSLISTVNFEESTNTIYVSVQVNNLADITNTIYAYNSSYEVQSINSYKNLLTIEMINTNNSKLILDPTRLYILDGKYKNVATIDAQNSFAGMVLVNEKIYLLDGNKNVRIYDKTGKLLEEKAFKDTINKMILDMPQIIYIGTTSVDAFDKPYTALLQATTPEKKAEALKQLQAVEEKDITKMPIFVLKNMIFVNGEKVDTKGANFGNPWFAYDLGFENWELK